MKSRSLLLLVPFCMLAGCQPHTRVYEPIAQHTLKASADAETDVVWVQRFDAQAEHTHLLRCTSVQGAPRCDEAKVP
jgi:hypothetical protein